MKNQKLLVPSVRHTSHLTAGRSPTQTSNVGRYFIQTVFMSARCEATELGLSDSMKKRIIDKTGEH